MAREESTPSSDWSSSETAALPRKSTGPPIPSTVHRKAPQSSPVAVRWVGQGERSSESRNATESLLCPLRGYLYGVQEARAGDWSRPTAVGDSGREARLCGRCRSGRSEKAGRRTSPPVRISTSSGRVRPRDLPHGGSTTCHRSRPTTTPAARSCPTQAGHHPAVPPGPTSRFPERYTSGVASSLSPASRLSERQYRPSQSLYHTQHSHALPRT